jgi:hypothetical protein
MSSTSRMNKKRAGKTYAQPGKLISANLEITIMPRTDWGFGGADRVSDYPVWSSIPERFKQDNDPFVRMQQRWFFAGIKGNVLVTRAGVGRIAALKHLSALQESFAPSHEHKQAAVAYLMAMWFDLAE